MKNNIFLLLTAISCCLGIGQLSAQTSQIQYFVPQPFPRSPTSTALEKYGTYQVNEFTGIPDISIPLYTIQAGGLQLPVTLSYHASGIKVTDVASWAGLGWSVSSGGQISRKTMGIADDQPYGLLNGGMHLPSTVDASTEAGKDYLENAATGVYDTKPDIYSYDFPGHGGKFFFDGSGGGTSYPVRLLPFAPVKIQYLGYGFKITDEHGGLYNYGGTGAVETTASSSGGVPGVNRINAAWKIASMISRDRRDTVSFSYNICGILYPAADGEIYTVTDNINNMNANPYSYNPPSTPTTPGNNNQTDELIPNQINFKNGKVVFHQDDTVRTDINQGGASNNAKGLKDITVYSYNYATRVFEAQKVFKFFKSYFLASDGSKRLRLDSIQVQDKAGSVIQHYRFDYNTAINLPGYTSDMIDYWGYYNGKANNYLTPQQTNTYTPYSNSPNTAMATFGSSMANGRNCDSNYMQACVLTGIHYPTGGYTTFAYQTNQYSDQNNVLQQAGGLRIKTISSYDGTGAAPVVKTYIYNSARANFLLDYNYFTTSQTHRYFASSIGGENPVLVATCLVHTYFDQPHCDLEGYDGATVVYPSVSEYTGTPANNTGRTDYAFSDQADGLLDASRQGSLIYLSHFYARGQLGSKLDYLRKTDGTYQLVKEVDNAYTAFPFKYYPNVGVNAIKLWYNEGPGGANPMVFPQGTTGDDSNAFQYVPYEIDSDDNLITSTRTTTYDQVNPANYTTTSVSYKYDDTTHQQAMNATHTDSRGNTSISVSKFPYSYAAGNAVIDTMVNQHIWADPVEKYDTLKDAATGVKAVVSGQFNRYKFGGIANTVVPSAVSTLSVPAPLTNFVPSAVTSGSLGADSRYAQMISFDQYDAHNNVTQYTPRNATPTSVAWDYQAYLPEAQVKNAKNGSSAAQFAYTGFEGDVSNGWYLYGKPVIDNTAPAGSMSYPLSSGNIIQQTTDNSLAGIISLWSKGAAPSITAGSTSLTASALQTANGWTYYEYPLAANYGSITISGSTSIDELRLYPATAQMTTYSYDPSGLRTEEDTKGTNTYFEYDYFQRLKNAKDWQGNIIKNYGYHTYDQTYSNQVQSTSIPRNNCPANYTPGALTYTVPAGRYYSSTQASANTEAAYDMQTNGQAKANANCSCTIQTTAFNFSNSTGYTGFTASFTGGTNPVVNFPATGSTPVQVPIGNYSSVYIGPVGSNTHTFSFGSQQVTNAHYATFTNINVTAGSNLTLSIQ